MINVLASIRVKDGQRAAFLEIFHDIVPKVRVESGCLEYFPAVDIDAGLGAQQLDEDFLEALQYGMPPAGGFGMSERLFAVLMDRPVRETVFFPLMRPKK